MTTDAMLINVSMIIRARDTLKPESREQVSKNSLANIKMFLTHCAGSLARLDQLDTETGIRLVDCIDLINILLGDVSFVQTDTDLKNRLLDNVSKCKIDICLSAGKFYEENDFNYESSKFNILREIVDVNIENGYYFGKGVKYENGRTL